MSSEQRENLEAILRQGALPVGSMSASSGGYCGNWHRRGRCPPT